MAATSVSTKDAAHELGISASTLTRWARSGTVRPALRTVGGHMRWNVDDLHAQLVEAGAILPNPDGVQPSR